MTLAVESSEKKGVTVVTVRGRLIMQHGAKLQDEVKRQVSEGARRVLVDMTEVDYIDSFGLGQMVACMKALGEQKGKIRFAGLSDKVRKLIDISAVYKILDLDPDLRTGLSRIGHS
jgi:anti-sigma B factor antagonist